MKAYALQKLPSNPDAITVAPASRWQTFLHSTSAVWARSPLAHRVLSAFLLIGLPGIGAYAHLIEPTWLRIKRLTLPLPNLPASLDGFRLVHLSDLHMGSEVPSWFLRRVIETVQRLAPDLIVLTGDFVHTCPENVDDLTVLLSKLCAPAGVFAVLGNHDYAVNYPGDAGLPGVEEMVVTALERAGIVVLRNDWVPITIGRSRFTLAGLDELWSGRARTAPLQTIPSALSRIVLCHNPEIVQFLPENSFDLLLCGHTHGGQVRIPPFPPLVTATADRRFWGGLTAHGRGWVFVSRGVGYTWRVRFASRPECVEITLTGQRAY